MYHTPTTHTHNGVVAEVLCNVSRPCILSINMDIQVRPIVCTHKVNHEIAKSIYAEPPHSIRVAFRDEDVVDVGVLSACDSSPLCVLNTQELARSGGMFFWKLPVP